MYNVTEKNNNLIIDVTKNDYNLCDTFDCGQCFRFKRIDENTVKGVVFGRVLSLSQTDTQITIENMTSDELNQKYISYLDFTTDYSKIKERLKKDETLNKAIGYAGGIRVLKQDLFETTVSFIISQNNNIPRIKNSIEKICKKYGQPITDEDYAFPTPDELSKATVSDFKELGLGYRDEYLYEFTKKVLNEEIKLEDLEKMPIDEARKELLKIKGIGKKVAECILLFGYHKTEAFPIDTWIKKVLGEYYKDGFPDDFYDVGGIAQQYLFHYIRTGLK